jgi:hypothetical protein
MAGGKAYGISRQYHVDCRDVLRARYAELEPWEGDGIDVPFNLLDPWNLDVALRAPDGALVVAECRLKTSRSTSLSVNTGAYC